MDTSAPLSPAKGDQVHDGEWPQECLLPWEVALDGTDAPQRPAVTIHQLSSICSYTYLFYPLFLPSQWDQMLSSMLIDLLQYPSEPKTNL